MEKKAEPIEQKKKTEQIEQMQNLVSSYLQNNLDTIDLGDKSVFFGTGLASTENLSKGFGIDIFSTIFSALKVRDILNAKKVIHLINNEGYNITEEQAKVLIEEQKEIIGGIIRNLGLEEKYQLILSSDFTDKEDFKKLKEKVGNILRDFKEKEIDEKLKEYEEGGIEAKLKAFKEDIKRIITTLGLQMKDKYGRILSNELMETDDIKKEIEYILKEFNKDGIEEKLKAVNPEDLESILNRKKEIEYILELLNAKINFEKYGNYTILQTAICRYLYEKEGVRVKIGWCFENNKERPDIVTEEYLRILISEGHNSEFYFDVVYDYVDKQWEDRKEQISYVYTPPGYGLDGKGSIPYTVTDDKVLDSSSVAEEPKYVRPLISEKIFLHWCNYMDELKKTGHYSGNSKKNHNKKMRKAFENWDRTIVKPYEELFGEISLYTESKNSQTISALKLGWIQREILKKRIKDMNDNHTTPVIPGSNEGGR